MATRMGSRMEMAGACEEPWMGVMVRWKLIGEEEGGAEVVVAEGTRDAGGGGEGVGESERLRSIGPEKTLLVESSLTRLMGGRGVG